AQQHANFWTLSPIQRSAAFALRNAVVTMTCRSTETCRRTRALPARNSDRRQGFLARSRTSPALHRRHDGNLLARVQLVIATNKFQTCGNQNAVVMRTKCGSFRIQLLEQIANRRTVRKLELQLAHSNQI